MEAVWGFLLSNRKKATQRCQCGFFGDPLHECSCTPPLIQRYLARISGPLLDRIDLHIQVPAVKYKELAQDEKTEESAVIRERIMAARKIQFKRLEAFGIYCNAQMTPRTLRRFCKLDSENDKQMENAITKLGLSARAYDRILRVSRTIADLEGQEKIQAKHVSEAWNWRGKFPTKDRWQSHSTGRHPFCVRWDASKRRSPTLSKAPHLRVSSPICQCNGR